MQFRKQGCSKEQIETLDVMWEGDPRSPNGQPAAARPPDMNGFIKVVADRVKFRVQLAPTLELALADDDVLWGCSFENPRGFSRVYVGSPLVTLALTLTLTQTLTLALALAPQPPNPYPYPNPYPNPHPNSPQGPAARAEARRAQSPARSLLDRFCIF